jgi:hypothetical protein
MKMILFRSEIGVEIGGRIIFPKSSPKHFVKHQQPHSSMDSPTCVQNRVSNHRVTNVRMKGEDDGASTELKDCQSFSKHDKTFEEPFMSAPATSDVCDSCKATEPQASADKAEHAITARFNRFTIPSCSSAPTTCQDGSLVSSVKKLPATYKIDGKPKIDGNFFKSMAKSIKANRASIAGSRFDVVDGEECTQHTGYYAPSSCSENTHYQHWIEGDAMRMRIELKFRLIHARMLASEESSTLWR